MAQDNLKKSRIDCVSLKKEEIKLVENWALSTTTHGVQKFTKADKTYLRIFWALFILVALVLCTYVEVNNIIQYNAHDVTTKIRIIDQKSVDFPVVSVCNINPFVSPSAQEFIRNSFRNSFNLSVKTYEDILKSGLSQDQIDLFYRWLIYQNNDPGFNESFRRSLGLTAEEMIVESLFMHVPSNVSYEYQWYFDYYYGSCFRYNFNQSNSLELQESGLELKLFAGLSDEYFDYLNPYPINGLRLFISDPETVPITTEGLLLKPGEHVNIQLSKTLAQNLPRPFSNCQHIEPSLSILTQEMNRLKLPYNRKDCLYLCFQKLTIDQFGCNDLQYPSLLNAEPCSNYTIFTQIKLFDYNISSCQDLCPFDCDIKTYSKVMSFSQFPSKTFFQKLTYSGKLSKYRSIYGFDLNYDMVKKSMASVFIYFDQLEVTQISEQEAISLVVLLSNFGGALGLFVGMSLLSILELVDLFIGLVLNLIKFAIKK